MVAQILRYPPLSGVFSPPRLKHRNDVCSNLSELNDTSVMQVMLGTGQNHNKINESINTSLRARTAQSILSELPFNYM
jgi:hypothetical protein